MVILIKWFVLIHVDSIEAGILASNFARLAIMNAAIRPDERLEPLYKILLELGYFIKRGDIYMRTGKLPPDRGDPIVANVIDNIIVPYLLGNSFELNTTLLHSFTYLFQEVRIRVASEILPWGGLTLVYGFLPCGFSSELSAQAGRDLVISDDFQDVLDVESERLSLLPIFSAPLTSYLAPAAFIAVEPTTDLSLLQSKYGKFDTAIVCHRLSNIESLRNISREIIYIYVKGVLGELATLMSKAVGLEQPPTCEELSTKYGGQIVENDESVCITDFR